MGEDTFHDQTLSLDDCARDNERETEDEVILLLWKEGLSFAAAERVVLLIKQAHIRMVHVR